MTNYYLKAIHETDRIDQLNAFRRFLEAEMRRVEDRLSELENDDGSIPDDNTGRWNYEKGQLDMLSTVYGIVVQSLMAAGAFYENAGDE